MSSAIGRAGKQVFTALEHGQAVGAARPVHASKPEPPQQTPNPTTHVFINKVATVSLTNKSIDSNLGNSRKRSDSADVDLDDTLAQLKLLDKQTVVPSIESTSPIPASFSAKHPNQSRQSSDSNSLEPLSIQDKSSVSIKQLAEETIALAGMDKNLKVADMEKEQLLAALQVLKMQNQMLTHKIEVDKQENQLKMDYERKARLAAVSVLEQENQLLLRQLTDSKNEAETKLQAEKRKFEETLRAIDEEKRRLQVQVRQLQEDSEKEISKLVQERDSIEKQAAELEKEKDNMYNQVLQLEATQDSSVSDELAALKLHLAQVESERQSLTAQLQSHTQHIHSLEHDLHTRIDHLQQTAQERIQSYEEVRAKAGEGVKVAQGRVGEEVKRFNDYYLQQHSKEDASGLNGASEANAPSSSSQNNATLPKVSNKEAAKQKAKALQERLKQRKLHKMNKSINKMKNMWEAEKHSNNSSMHSIDVKSGSGVGEGLGSGGGGGKKIYTRRSLVDMMNIQHDAQHSSASPPHSPHAPHTPPPAAPTNGIAFLEGGHTASSNAIYSINMPAAHAAKTSAPASNSTHKPAASSSQGPAKLAHAISARAPALDVKLKQKTIMDLDSDEDEDDDNKVGKKVENSAEQHGEAKEEQRASGAEGGDGEGEGEGDESLPPFFTLIIQNNIDAVKASIQSAPSLLDEYDDSHRHAIFYACVYGHMNMCILLLSLYSSNIYNAITNIDAYGDSLVHAATCSNNHMVLDLILNKMEKVLGKDEEEHGEGTSERIRLMNHQNSYGMTAAHMCSTVDCLERLYKAGANMCMVDNQQRSPLFIYCLINNESCTNFLLNCVDSNDFAYIVDHHGDTPLHAAACNGAIDCLLALLTHGYDPRLVNYQNLKAIDLAVRNKHQKCREMLAEYLLHYCTNSEFDSVLFLAVLEGHRFISQNIHKFPAPAPTSNTAQVSSMGSANPHSTSPTPMALPRLLNKDHMFPSIFNMRDHTKMKIESFGDWLAYHEPSTDQVFWYNSDSQVGQWEIPSSVLTLYHQHHLNIPMFDEEEEEDDMYASRQTHKVLTMCRNGDWIEYTCNNSSVFYYNEKDGSFTWEEPYSAYAANSYSATYSYNVSYATPNAETYGHDASYGQEYEYYQHTQDHASQATHDAFIAGDWQPYIDESSGCVYWYHTQTGESSWDNPYAHTALHDAYSNDVIVKQAMHNSASRVDEGWGETGEVQRVVDVHQLF